MTRSRKKPSPGRVHPDKYAGYRTVERSRTEALIVDPISSQGTAKPSAATQQRAGWNLARPLIPSEMFYKSLLGMWEGLREAGGNAVDLAHPDRLKCDLLTSRSAKYALQTDQEHVMQAHSLVAQRLGQTIFESVEVDEPRIEFLNTVSKADTPRGRIARVHIFLSSANVLREEADAIAECVSSVQGQTVYAPRVIGLPIATINLDFQSRPTQYYRDLASEFSPSTFSLGPLATNHGYPDFRPEDIQ